MGLIDATAEIARSGGLHRVASIGSRYGIATAGQVCVSGANFLVSLALLRTLPTTDFGLYAFILVVSGFCFSLSNALIVSPYTVLASRRDFGEEQSRTFFKANLLLSLAAELLCGGVAFAMKAGGSETPLLFGLFGAMAMLRWFGRAHCYAIHAPLRVATVDIVYSILLLSGLGFAWFMDDLTLDTALISFAVAGTVAVVATGKDYIGRQFIQAYAGRLRGYAPIWKNQARWSLLGVVTTEASFNAHAYLVTLIAGPSAFAPLAAAALFMKPLNMCSSSLVQLERPAMARAIAESQFGHALRLRNNLRWAMMLCWLGVVAVAAGVFLFFPRLVLSDAYSLETVMIAVILCAANEGIIAWVGPDAVLFQAADRFRLLAETTVWSACVTIVAATILLLAFGPLYGPVASLVGVLIGQIAQVIKFTLVKRTWKWEHA